MSRSAAVVALLALLPLSQAHADDVLRDRGVVRVDRSATSRVGVDGLRIDRLLGLLEARAAEFGWQSSPGASLDLRAASRPLLGRARGEMVTVQGAVAGVPLHRPLAHVVLGSDDGEVRLVVSEGPVAPLIANPLRAVATADAALQQLVASGRPGTAGATGAELVAVAGEGETRLAWRIDPPLDWRHLTNPVFLVDGATGSVTIDYDHVRTAKVVAFPTNPVRSEAAEFDLLNIDEGATSLTGPYFVSRNCSQPGGAYGCMPEARAVADTNGDFLYPAPDVTNPDNNILPDDEFSEVSMYYHADKFLEFLRGFGFPGLNCHTVDEVPATLVSNFKRYDDDKGTIWTPYDNAFYTGQCDLTMVFGQGTQVDFAYDGDVVYHELGHGVVEAQRATGLGGSRPLPEALAVDAGGLNEAIADFVSSSFAGDPIVADYIGEYWDRLADTKAIRDNSNAYVCPHDLVGESHLDGEPFAALMWFAFVEFGEDIVPAVLDTTTALASNALLGEAATTFAAMAEMHAGAEASAFIENMATERGLVDCLRITTPDRLRREMFVQGNGNYKPHAPPPLQLSAEVPADVNQATVTFEAAARGNSFGDDPGEITVGLLVKQGTHMTFTYSGTNVTVDSDQRIDDIVDTVSFPVTAGEPVYFGFISLDEVQIKVDNIQVSFDNDGGGDTDTGDTGDTGDTDTGDTGADDTGTDQTDTEDPTDGDDAEDAGDEDTDDDDDGGGGANDDDKGCGCRSHDSSQWPVGLGLLGLVAFVTRRRIRG